MRMNTSCICAIGAAGAIAAMVALLATDGRAAVVGPSIVAPVKAEPVAPIQQLKELYRRPRSIPFPADNPYTIEKLNLGKKLFFDTRLSVANILSCASCHSPAYGWGDGQPKGVGHGMRLLGRRSPSVVNAAFGHVFMWDGRAPSLEAQSLGSIASDTEMNLPLDQVIQKLQRISAYPQLFQAAFPSEGLASQSIAKAIATYERTVVSGPAPFDAWIEGDEAVISEQAKRGFMLFNTKGGCAKCHSGWNFTDDSFHDIGLADADIGRAKFLPNVVKMGHAFKTPGLRDITRRAPYMHDGSLPSLEAVVAHYNSGGVNRPSRADEISALGLSKEETDDLVAFMMTTTGETAPTVVPVLPQ